MTESPTGRLPSQDPSPQHLPIPDRADSDSKKIKLLVRLMKAWSRMPDLRLGQLIWNAMPVGRTSEEGDKLFFIEDEATIQHVESFVKEHQSLPNIDFSEIEKRLLAQYPTP